MSHDPGRKDMYSRDRGGHERPREWTRPPRIDYTSRDPRTRDDRMSRKRSRSLSRSDIEKRRRSPPSRKNDKDMIDDNILSEIAKLPEPSELWDAPNVHFQEGGFPQPPPPPPPPGFQPPEPPNPSFAANYQPSYSGVYDDFPPTASAPPDIASWNQMSLPPPPGPHTTYQNAEDQMKKDAAIETEMRHQKAALSKQREDYIKKAGILKKELDTLKDQRNELRGDAKRSPSPDTKRFLKENTKLQLEIQNKLKTITNVVDMLNGIIGEEARDEPRPQLDDDSPDRKRKSRSPSGKKFNYVYYDPEMHWCRVCNEFPPTAKDYLNHLHSVAHHKMAAAHMEAPWHTVAGMNEGYPSFPAAPTKRTPIRGLQFFVPSTAWYCKLCDQFIGDLHCASAHLKSITHSKNYINFVEQNPHWETDWMSDRQKAFEKARANLKNKPPEEKPQYTPHTISFSKDGFHTKTDKRKKSPSPPADDKKKKKEKKKKNKKKRGSSSSESSESSSDDSDAAKKKLKKSKKLKNIDVRDNKALEEWMTTIKTDKLTEADRKLLDNLKSRIKKERDEKRRSTSRDRQRVAEMQRKIRESEARGTKRAESRYRDEPSRRDERRSERRSERRDVRKDDRRDKSPDKKPDIKKMPFIGKMPVFKSITKAKEDVKKEEDKKKEEEEEEKKKQEIDAEIQRKVAEFKEKIAKSQHERSHQAVASASATQPALPPLPPPIMQMPVQPPPAPTPLPPGAPALPKDFQEALDIIFPTGDAHATEKLHQDLLQAMQPGILGVPPLMAPFNHALPPHLNLVQHQMFGFDLNAGLFPQPQLYDSHVPLSMPTKPLMQPKPLLQKPLLQKPLMQNKPLPMPPKQLQYKHKQPTNRRNDKFNKGKNNNAKANAAKEQAKANGEAAAAKIKEELDDLAMLGIDASDVGSGMKT